MALHKDYRLRKLVITNSIPQTDEFETLPFVSILSLANTLSQVINRIHYNRSVTGLFYQNNRLE
jgi:phosphoribosylpyrophosphate synthetase